MQNNLGKELDKFAKRVVQQSRSRLTRGGNNASNKLYESIGYDLNVSKNSFSLSFEMEEYGQYQDQGVSGKKKKYSTPFKYTTKRPPASSFIGWAKTRNIKPRDKKTGRFITNKSFGFILSRYIFEQGIRPKRFFSLSFEQQFKKLPDEIIEAYALDLDNFLDFTI